MADSTRRRIDTGRSVKLKLWKLNWEVVFPCLVIKRWPRWCFVQSKSHSWPAICSWTQICSWSVTFQASGCVGLGPSTLHQYGGPTAGLSLRISNYRKISHFGRCWEFWRMPTFNYNYYSCGSSKQHFNCQHFRQIQAPWMRSTRRWRIY